jgi:hypothetical protein
MIVSLLLIITGIVGMSALLYRIAIYALPTFIGFSIAFWVYHSGTGIVGAFALGAFAAGFALALGAGLLAAARSGPLRALVLLAFALPAAYTGYSILFQLAEAGSLASFWRGLFSILGAAIVGWSATARLLGPPGSSRHGAGMLMSAEKVRA